MKEFHCPECGYQSFTMVHRKYTAVDFSKEGAIEGHPALTSAGEVFECFICDNCTLSVPEGQAKEILREVT